MNQSNQNQNETDALREDIDDTRRRMDDTMDALGERLEPRHLVDEFLGFLRGESQHGDTRYHELREKVTRSASQAMGSVVNTVKQNPVPALLIGAGVAWMLYESTREKRPRSPDGDYYGYDRDGERLQYDPDAYLDRPLEYPPGTSEADWNGQGESKLGHARDKIAGKASAAAEQVKEKLSDAGEVVREKAGELRERAGEVTSRVKRSTQQAYVKTRDRVVTTADQHPLEVGFVALATGILAGLALPTPSAVNRRVGPTADRLRDRTRQASSEMLDKGKRVARAAVTAAKDEAKAQGLTPEKLKEKGNAVLERAQDSAQQATEAAPGSPPADAPGQ